MLVNGPKDLHEEGLFQERFGGSLGVFYGIDTWGYDKKNKLYPFPEDMTDERLSEMLKKSLEDNHDYVFDFLQKNSKEAELLPDVFY